MEICSAIVARAVRRVGLGVCGLGSLVWVESAPAQESSTIFAGSGGWLAISNNKLWGSGTNQPVGTIGGISTLGQDANTNLFLTYRIGGETNWKLITGLRGSNEATFAIRTDGSLWAWGSNNLGQLGDGTGLNSKVPVRVGSYSNWKSISAADGKVFGLKTDGTLWAWGENRLNSGGLGIGRGRDTKQYLPVQIGPGIFWASVTAVVSNQWFFPNGFLEISTNSSTARYPGLVLWPIEENYGIPDSLFDAWTLKKGGGGASVNSNGEIWSWGTTFHATADPSLSVATNFAPLRFGTESDWKEVVFGPRPYGLKKDGTLRQFVYTKGSNIVNPAGIGPTTNVWQFKIFANFQSIDGETATNWATLSAFCYEKPTYGAHEYLTNGSGEVDVFYFTGHVLGLKQDGTLWAWGNNSRGQLGLGTTERHILPQQVGSETNWVEVSAGPYWSMGKKADGSIWAWGDIGGSASPYVKVPTRVGTDNDWLTAVAGSDYSLAVKTDGKIYACGRAEADYLAVQTNFSRIKTDGANRTDSTWGETGWTRGVAAYRRKMVAIETNGNLRIWGDAFGDYPGDGRTNLPVPIPDDLDTTRPWWDPERYEPGVLNLAGPWASVSGNSGTADEGDRSGGNTLPAGFAAAVRGDGTLWAWGANTNGQLGDGTRVPKDLPVQIGEGTNWLKVEAGGKHMLAMQKDGSVWAWGGNEAGQHGIKATNLVGRDSVSNPVSVETTVKVDIRYAPVRITTNITTNYRVTIRSANEVVFDTNVIEPANILPAAWKARDISGGGNNSLILKADGSLWQLGNAATETNRESFPLPSVGPLSARTNLVTNISLAPVRIFANLYFNVPSAVATNRDLTFSNQISRVGSNNWFWQGMSAGNRHNLAVRTDGTLWAWGENSSAQLGDGSLTGTNFPKKVGAGNRWRKVFAGKEHSLAIKDDGSLWAWGLNDGRLSLPFATAQTFYEPTPVYFGPVALATVMFENGQTDWKKITGSGLAFFSPQSNSAVFSAQLTDGLLGSFRRPWEGNGKYSFLGTKLVFSNAYLSFLDSSATSPGGGFPANTNSNSIPEAIFVRLQWGTLERSPTNPLLYQGDAKYFRGEGIALDANGQWSSYDNLKRKNGVTCRVSFLFDQDQDGDGIPDLADALQGIPPVITSTNRLNLRVASSDGLPYRITTKPDTNSGAVELLANEDLSALPDGLGYTTGGFDGFPSEAAVGRWEIVVGARNNAGEIYQTVFVNVPPLITSPDTWEWSPGAADFEYQITATTNNTDKFPIIYSAASLPAGLVVNPTNGWIRPAKAGQTNLPAPGLYRWSVVASNAGGATTNTVEVSVRPPGTGEWTAGSPLAYALNLAPGATYAVNGLPPGLTFNAATRQIIGTPLSAGTNEVTIVSRTRTETNTNRVTLAIRLGRPEIVGSTTLSFTGPLSLKRNEFFRYQISARSAGQPWAGASEFAVPLAPSWSNATGFRANLSAVSGTLRYGWTNTNAAFASLDWSQPLPLDASWQASVEAAFSTNNLSGFLQNQQYLSAMLLALRDRSSNSAGTNFVSVYVEGSTNFPSGEVVAEGVVDGVTNGSVSEEAVGGRSVLSFLYLPADGAMVTRADAGRTNLIWSEFQTNSLLNWTNPARSNSLVLRLMGQSAASTNRTVPFPVFRRFVVSPLGDLSYSSSNLPAGITLDAQTGLIYGVPTLKTNLHSCNIIISNSLGATNLVLRFSVQ